MNPRVKGKLVRKTACPNPNCGSSDALAIYANPGTAPGDEDRQDAHCFSCGHHIYNLNTADPIDSASLDSTPVKQGDNQSNVRSLSAVKDVLGCPHLPIPVRGIKQSTVDFYDVRSMLSGFDGKTPVAVCFPYFSRKTEEILGFKKRVLESKIFSTIGDVRLEDISLFGAQKFKAGGKRVYITEGEIDCLSLYQVLKDLSGPEWKHLDPCVVSLPHGAASAANALSHNRDFLDKFSEIVLVFDQDDAGRAAVESCCAFLPPEKVRIATFSEKDANDMLLAGKSSELKWAVLTQAKAYRPDGIATSKTLLLEALVKPERGVDWPWPTLTRLTYGRRPGLIGFGAGVGIGKTKLFHELIWHTAGVQHRPIGVFLLEEAPVITMRTLGGIALNKPANRPDVYISEEDLKAVLLPLSEPRELLFIFDHKGSRDWNTIMSQCKWLAAVHGVRDIIIDPLTAIISHEENTDRALHKLMADMSQLSQAPYNCTVYFSSHLNEPPRNDTPHEEGGRVMESQFAGSRAMIRFSNYIFALERNKQDPDKLKRNTTTFRILKDRDFGNSTGKTFEIFYDDLTGRYLEVDTAF